MSASPPEVMMTLKSEEVVYELVTLDELYVAHTASVADPNADLSTPWTAVVPVGGQAWKHVALGASLEDADLPPSWSHKYRFNRRGRVVIKTNPLSSPTGLCRELLLVWKGGNDAAITGEVAALVAAVDLNCYHIGYPLDMGDIEDVHVCPALGGDEKDDDKSGPQAEAMMGTIRTITCLLHSRIFDLDTGDMVRMEFSKNMPEALRTPVTPTTQRVACGFRKDGIVLRDHCRQRVHPVRLSPHGRLVVADSIYSSDLFWSDKFNTTGETARR